MECSKNGAKLDNCFDPRLRFGPRRVEGSTAIRAEKSEIHKFSVMAMQNFLAAMRRQTAPIHQQLNWLMQAQIDENREKMKSIVKIVVFCDQNKFR